MPIAVRGTVTTGVDFGGAPFTVSKPSGVVQDDVMYALLQSQYYAYADLVGPAGWTLLDGINSGGLGGHSKLFRKVAGSSEPASYTFSASSNGSHVTASIIALSGVPLSGGVPVEVVAKSANNTDTAPSVTPPGGADFLLCCALSDHDNAVARTYTPPAGMTERIEVSQSYLSHTIATQQLAAGGATGTRDFSGTGTGDRFGQYSLAVGAGGGGGASLTRSVGDTAAAADGLARTAGRPRAVADAAPAADALTRTASRARSQSDAAAATDATVRAVGHARTHSDAAPAMDSTSAATTGQITRSVGDTAGANDALSRAVSRLRALAEVAAGTDTAARVAARIRALSDSAPAADSVSASTTGQLSRGITDAAPAADALARLVSRLRTVPDAAPAADAAARVLQRTRLQADAAPAVDGLTQLGTRARTLTDLAPAVDSTTGQYASGTAPVPVEVAAALRARRVGASLLQRGAAGRLKPRAVTAGVRE